MIFIGKLSIFHINALNHLKYSYRLPSCMCMKNDFIISYLVARSALFVQTIESANKYFLFFIFINFAFREMRDKYEMIFGKKFYM